MKIIFTKNDFPEKLDAHIIAGVALANTNEYKQRTGNTVSLGDASSNDCDEKTNAYNYIIELITKWEND